MKRELLSCKYPIYPSIVNVTIALKDESTTAKDGWHSCLQSSKQSVRDLINYHRKFRRSLRVLYLYSMTDFIPGGLPNTLGLSEEMLSERSRDKYREQLQVFCHRLEEYNEWEDLALCGGNE